MFLACIVSYNLNIVGFLTFNLLILNFIIIEVLGGISIIKNQYSSASSSYNQKTLTKGKLTMWRNSKGFKLKAKAKAIMYD